MRCPRLPSVLRGQAREQGLLNTSNDLAKSLAAARPEVALSDVLRPATEKALPRGSPQTIRNSDVWENAKTLLAWLSVLAVRPEWVQKREQLDSDGESTFEILVRTECGVEILSSRYRQLRPRFGPVRGFDIVGEERLDLPVVESGWDDEYAVRQIGLDIAAQLFPELKSASQSDREAKRRRDPRQPQGNARRTRQAQVAPSLSPDHHRRPLALAAARLPRNAQP
jgi:hypothetical protein